MIRLACVGVLPLILAGPAAAQTCHAAAAPVVAATTYAAHGTAYQQTYQQQAVAVVVPLFTAVYSPPGTDEAAAATREQTASLVAELAALRAEVAGLRPPAPVPANAPKAVPKPAAPARIEPIKADITAAGVMQASCAKCHAGANPKGGFALDPLKPTAEQSRAVLESVLSGTMPPAKKLTPEERRALLAGLVR